MQIIEFFQSDRQEHWAEQIRNCDWNAAAFLANLIEDKPRFDDIAGSDGKLFLLVNRSELISFAALTKKDCIEDDDLCPWIGFVFTCPEHRGKRYSGEIIDFACNDAASQGYKAVYLATEHTGLYEKYGFEFIGMRKNVYDGESRVYRKQLSPDT